MVAKKINSDRKRSRPVTKKKKSDVIKKDKLVSVFLIMLLLVAAIAGTYFVLTSRTEDEGATIAIISTSMGTIKVELYTEKAPITCDNFIKLANDGFYDGLVFHRVIDDFMIQSGGFDAEGDQKSSPYGQIELEIDEDLRHDDGAIAMARQGQDMSDPTFFNTATSQFYICDGEQHGLDDYYAVFGKVIEGMNVVRLIASTSATIKYGMQNWPSDDIIVNNIKIEKQ